MRARGLLPRARRCRRKSSAAALSPPSPALGSSAAAPPRRSGAVESAPDPSRQAVSSVRAAAPCRLAFEDTRPATRPLTEVFFALDRRLGLTERPSSMPNCSNQARAQRVSASKSPSCSVRISSEHWLIRPSAGPNSHRRPVGLHDLGVSEKTAMPGPIDACARSTGAMFRAEAAAAHRAAPPEARATNSLRVAKHRHHARGTANEHDRGSQRVRPSPGARPVARCASARCP